MLDLRSEKDIERLRQVALLLDSQMKHLLDVLANKCAELDKLKGSDRELQLALALLAQASKDTEQQTGAKPEAPKDRGGPRGGGDKGERKPREGHGPAEQPNLERVPLVCELDCADRTCPCCGGHLKPMVDQAERSEMIDIIDIKYQVVEVERRKYVCKCVTTGLIGYQFHRDHRYPGPGRASGHFAPGWRDCGGAAGWGAVDWARAGGRRTGLGR